MIATTFVAHPYQFPVIGWPSDIDAWTEDDLAEATLVMANLQRELAGLSTNSIHHVIPDAGHYIHWDAPEVVTSAIHDTVETWRTTQSTDT